MLAERNELALQLAVLAKLHPEWSMSELALKLGWAPLFLINAFDEGSAMELFTVDQEADTIKLVSEHPLGGQENLYAMGNEVARLTDEILYAIARANKEEQDVSLEQFQWSWLSSVPVAHMELAIEALLFSGLIGKYTMNDPYDENSVYTFFSLVSSVHNQWGSKQFKPRSKANKKRIKKEREGK